MTHPVNAYAALGGHPGLRRAVERFAELVLGDPTVADHFRAQDPGEWRCQQLELLAAAVGGPQRNAVATNATAPGADLLTEPEFNRVLGHLRTALIQVGADEDAVPGVIEAAWQTRNLIVIAPETTHFLFTERTPNMESGIDQPADNPPLYPIAEVAGHDPASLDDFVGATTVTVDDHGHRHDLLGAGTRAGESVLFFPRDEASVGEEGAVWTISEQPTGNLVAQQSRVESDWTSAASSGDLRDRKD